LEFAKNGELFDHISNGGGLSEPISRYYFKKLLIAIDFFHKNSISPLDIKFENMLLMADWKLKIYTGSLQDSTMAYNPPEFFT